jgi:hypothetical protein
MVAGRQGLSTRAERQRIDKAPYFDPRSAFDLTC